ncbi:MAG: flavodoxin domain-containing protein [Verrucomicrobiota bacterium]
MIHILFASETGDAKSMAHEVRMHVIRTGHEAMVLDMDSTSLGDLDQASFCLAVVSNRGEEGCLPMAKNFYEELVEAGGNRFSHLRYGVYARGEGRRDDEVRPFAKELDLVLERRGATRVLPFVENDLLPDTQFESWMDAVEGVLQWGGAR